MWSHKGDVVGAVLSMEGRNLPTPPPCDPPFPLPQAHLPAQFPAQSPCTALFGALGQPL